MSNRDKGQIAIGSLAVTALVGLVSWVYVTNLNSANARIETLEITVAEQGRWQVHVDDNLKILLGSKFIPLQNTKQASK